MFLRKWILLIKTKNILKLAIKLYRMYRTAFYTIKFKLTNMQSGVHTTWACDFWASKMFEESLISNLDQNLHMIIIFEEKNNGEKVHRQVYVNDIISSLSTSVVDGPDSSIVVNDSLDLLQSLYWIHNQTPSYLSVLRRTHLRQCGKDKMGVLRRTLTSKRR